MANRTSGRIPGQGTWWRCLKKPLILALVGGVLAVFFVGVARPDQAYAQVANGVYQGSVLDEDGTAVGTIKMTVSENKRAVTSIEFVDLATDCIVEVNGEPINREMDVIAPPVLFEGVGLFAFEGSEFFGFEAEEDGPVIDIILEATFVSDEELRGGMELAGFIPFFEEPPLSPPNGVSPCPELQENFGFFSERFSFVASLVSPPAPPATGAPTATTAAVSLPETGSGASSSGAQFWTIVLTTLSAITLVTAGLAVLRRRRAHMA